MKAHVISDTHVDFMGDVKFEAFRSGLEALQITSPSDLLIIAGDFIQIGQHEVQAQKRLEAVCGLYKKTLYVPGNHEYWRTSFTDVDALFDSWEDTIPGLIILRTGEVHTHEGLTFLGGTMWYPECEDSWVKSMYPDFNQIYQFEPEVYLRHNYFLSALKHVQKDWVVISHMAPFPGSIHPKFRGSMINEFFCYDATPHLDPDKMPKMWIHGHTHCPFSYSQGPTRVYCNPHGYPYEGENPAFWARIPIDI